MTERLGVHGHQAHFVPVLGGVDIIPEGRETIMTQYRQRLVGLDNQRRLQRLLLIHGLYSHRHLRRRTDQANRIRRTVELRKLAAEALAAEVAGSCGEVPTVVE